MPATDAQHGCMVYAKHTSPSIGWCVTRNPVDQNEAYHYCIIKKRHSSGVLPA